ncbi:HNH endonuclease signature motif containing protein [Nocardioides sp. NPDC006273]|uniref:HNH endonuclease signature motif containing protein n=1 Tax=Nocardioides sp. NPDC006273 TaxID=3155598 RepID=UPI0033A3E5A7
MESRLGTTPTHDLLASLAQTRVDEVRAANDRLVLVASYLLERPPRSSDDVAYDRDAGLFEDRALSLAGEGAAEVSEFAVMELGPVLGMPLGSVRRLAGDVMELAQRLPRVWARILDYSVEGWRARQVAELTKKLSPEAAGWVDAQVAPILHKRGRVTISRLVEKAFAMFDPEGAALAAEEKAEQFRVDVDLNAPTLFDEDPGRLGDGPATGHAHVDATMDLVDAADLENAVAAIARELSSDDRFAGWSVGRRRAKALGELARRYAADAGVTDTARVLHLYCHVDQGDLRGTGLVSVDNFGAIVPIERVDEWALTPGTVVRPVKVIDLNAEITRDGYAPSATQHEQAALIAGGTCVYPGCTRSAWLADTEHLEAYDDGGQTASSNLAKTCRSHHRLKTFGGWTYTQPTPGTFVWRSPLGFEYVRFPDGTYEPLTDQVARAC